MKPVTHKRTNPAVFSRSKELRHNMTPEERKLWACLRSHRQDRLGFRRQHAIGNYIADFCCPPSLQHPLRPSGTSPKPAGLLRECDAEVAGFFV